MKYIPLTQGKFTLIDDEDFERVNQYKWTFDGRYAYRKQNKKTIRIHQFILNIKTDKTFKQIDHINGNKLDNRRTNLRIVSASQNRMNKGLQINNHSGYKGIYWKKDKNKWRAEIIFQYKNIHIGYFINLNDAIKARKQAEQKYFGEYNYA